MQYHTHSDTKVNAVNNMIDTLKYSEEFKKAGFDDKQSKALAHTIANTIKQISPNFDELATKFDIKKIDKEIHQINKEIYKINKEIYTINKETNQIKLEIEKTKSDLELKIEQTRSNLLQWMIGIFSGQTAILITAFYTITKL